VNPPPPALRRPANVIVATPPLLAAEIRWTRCCPRSLDAMQAADDARELIKITPQYYPEPFWRKEPGGWMA